MKLEPMKMMVALLLLYPGVAALGQARADPTLVESLIQKSGMARQVEQFPQMVQVGIAQAGQQN